VIRQIYFDVREWRDDLFCAAISVGSFNASVGSLIE
jgi:hypothetical protein